jgi:hypothetical protein
MMSKENATEVALDLEERSSECKDPQKPHAWLAAMVPAQFPAALRVKEKTKISAYVAACCYAVRDSGLGTEGPLPNPKVVQLTGIPLGSAGFKTLLDTKGIYGDGGPVDLERTARRLTNRSYSAQ